MIKEEGVVGLKGKKWCHKRGGSGVIVGEELVLGKKREWCD